MHLAFQPFRLPSPIAPCQSFISLPVGLIGFLFFSKVWVSPFSNGLAVTAGRIEFVIPESSSGQAQRTGMGRSYWV